MAGAGSAKKSSSLVGGDLNFGLGLTRSWDAGVSFPFILHQELSDDSSLGHYSNTGNTEIRVNTKYQLLGSHHQGLALVPSANFNRIAHNPYLGEGGGPIFNLELAAHTTVQKFVLGLNLGYRWRIPGKVVVNSGIEPLADQYLASGPINYRLESLDSKIVFEILSALPKQHQLQSATDRQYSVLESLLGFKYDNSANLSFNLGAGAGLIHGVSSPDYRVYVGINFSFGSVRGKHSSQSDPYAAANRRRAFQNTRNKRRLEIAAAATSLMAPAPHPAAPPAVTPSRKPFPKPVPPVETPAEEEEIVPAKSVETIKEVRVYNRGSFNHIVLQNIEFIENTMSLKPESERYLKTELLPALGELNRRRPIGTIVVEGHTDSLGDAAYNLLLSKARAEVVGALLRQNLGLKIPVKTLGQGSASPIADNGNYQGRALNRRVEIKILYQRSSR